MKSTPEKSPSVNSLTRGDDMYFVVEVIHSTKTKTVGQDEDLREAYNKALAHNNRTGLETEVQNEFGKAVLRVYSRRD